MSDMPATPARLPLLLVEDEPSVMEFMRTALERRGYMVVSANSGVEALRLLGSGSSYLGVITDMRTPGGVNGADVHAWVTTHRPELVSRIMFVTGDTVNDETIAILRDTGAPCVEKPFRVQQLMSMVEKMFGKAP
jgi:two-component system NtrC family sensor kinase